MMEMRDRVTLKEHDYHEFILFLRHVTQNWLTRKAANREQIPK